ncbi:hypothetical protein VTN77DRAFT_9677 [Rasamsonia byssochlamydoides]|uniref:uncharacterized protein n=1 Tax=Rasamsonia byssochlamydoides TaxID=89139 RepID=UPI0037430C1A
MLIAITSTPSRSTAPAGHSTVHRSPTTQTSAKLHRRRRRNMYSAMYPPGRPPSCTSIRSFKISSLSLTSPRQMNSDSTWQVVPLRRLCKKLLPRNRNIPSIGLQSIGQKSKLGYGNIDIVIPASN